MNNKKVIPLDYVNGLIYELEKAFWDERGLGTRFRMTTIGREYYQDKVRPLIQSSELEHILVTIQDVLQNEGITGKVSCDQDGRLLRVSVERCIHQQVEERMNKRGIQPFTCVPANLIGLAIEEKLDRPVELAEVKIDNSTCHLLLVVFNQRPTLD